MYTWSFYLKKTQKQGFCVFKIDQNKKKLKTGIYKM